MQNYNYNRALYESIINEVARIVKKRLNENFDSEDIGSYGQILTPEGIGYWYFLEDAI